MALLRLRLRSAAILLALSCGAAAQTLQDLQRQLDEARRQKAASAAAAERQAAEQMAQLVVRSDASCQLRVDSRPVGNLLADVPRTIRVAKGNVLVECQAGDAGIRYKATHALEAGARKAVAIELREQLSALQQRSEAARAAETRRVEDRRAEERKAEERRAEERLVEERRTTAATSTRTASSWSGIRAALAASRGGRSLVESMTVLLDANDRDDQEAIAQFDALLRRLPYSSALAIGTRDGLLVYNSVWRNRSPQMAEDEALARCRPRADGCVVVMVNGGFRGSAFETLGAGLARREPRAVREATLRAMRISVAKGY